MFQIDAHAFDMLQNDTRLDQMASLQSARNSLIELGVNPLVSLASNVLDAIGEESEQVPPAASAALPEQGPRPSTLTAARHDVRSHTSCC